MLSLLRGPRKLPTPGQIRSAKSKIPEKRLTILSCVFHEKAGECQAFLSFFFFFFFISCFSQLFPRSQAASVATLPSALFVER